uniref:UDP glucuronosyltransferase 5 family, polypeptide C1 n=1 Tax=Tetraodon nigroviridis TaxID=99883 RepID=H3C6U5_TETNG
MYYRVLTAPELGSLEFKKGIRTFHFHSNHIKAMVSTHVQLKISKFLERYPKTLFVFQMSPIFFCGPLVLLCLVTPRACDGGNILVVPAEGSHWINMEVLLQALHSRGHNITVMRNSKSWYVRENSTYFQTVTVQVERSLDQTVITDMISEFLQFERGALPLTSFLHFTFGLLNKMTDVHSAIGEFVPATLNDHDLMRTLKENKYDLMLTDPCWGAGLILAKYLDLPLVYNVRWLLTLDAHLEMAPSPLSYIPITGSGHSDKMTFLQRVKNTILWQFHLNLLIQQVHDFYQLMLDADIWLMRADFVFESQTNNSGQQHSTGGLDATENDLLGHPKTKLFVAHGGTNGVQEAIYHGVPVVGLPLFFDQYDNLLRLKERGGAEILDFKTVDKNNNFLTAVQRVLHDPSYRTNMQRLSRLHRDQPMKPMDTAVFWIDSSPEDRVLQTALVLLPLRGRGFVPNCNCAAHHCNICYCD